MLLLSICVHIGKKTKLPLVCTHFQSYNDTIPVCCSFVRLKKWKRVLSNKKSLHCKLLYTLNNVCSLFLLLFSTYVWFLYGMESPIPFLPSLYILKGKEAVEVHRQLLATAKKEAEKVAVITRALEQEFLQVFF